MGIKKPFITLNVSMDINEIESWKLLFINKSSNKNLISLDKLHHSMQVHNINYSFETKKMIWAFNKLAIGRGFVWQSVKPRWKWKIVSFPLFSLLNVGQIFQQQNNGIRKNWLIFFLAKQLSPIFPLVIAKNLGKFDEQKKYNYQQNVLHFDCLLWKHLKSILKN